MAIVKNFWLKNQTKKLAGMVLYKAMGQTRSRELASEVSNPRTIDQMSQRVRWSNLVNFYRANKSWMKFAYETKPKNRTDYNQFMSLNAGTSSIYLPKSLASQGACIVNAYKMTQGSLASIECVESEGNWNTNLYLPLSFGLLSTTTIAEFATALISQNPAIREGDQLSFIRLTQQTNASTGVPFVVIRKYEVILKTDDLRFLRDFMPLEYFTTDETETQQFLIVNNSGLAGGFLLILSRTVGGKTYVSTQSIIVANNDAMITQYSSDAALQAAIDSYGESSEPFLTSTTADQDSQAPVVASVVSIEVDSSVHTPRSIVYPIDIDNQTELKVTMSKLLSDTPSELAMVLVKGGREYTIPFEGVAASGSTYTFQVQGQTQGIEEAAISDVHFTAGGTDYRAVFVVPNAATIGGLE
jgi:hypothetical protein